MVETKSIWCGFRASPAEKLKLARVARKWKMGQSEVMRLLIANLDERSMPQTVITMPEAAGKAEQVS